MVYAVKVSRVDQKEQAKSISYLESQTLLSRPQSKIFVFPGTFRTLKCDQMHGLLLLEVSTPGDAIKLVQEALLDDGELKDRKLFSKDSTSTLQVLPS